MAKAKHKVVWLDKGLAAGVYRFLPKREGMAPRNEADEYV